MKRVILPAVALVAVIVAVAFAQNRAVPNAAPAERWEYAVLSSFQDTDNSIKCSLTLPDRQVLGDEAIMKFTGYPAMKHDHSRPFALMNAVGSLGWEFCERDANDNSSTYSQRVWFKRRIR